MSAIPVAGTANARGLTQLPLRDELRGQSAYGAPQIDVPVRLNTNENPYQPPTEVVAAVAAAVAEAAAGLHRYPDRDALELRARLASYVDRIQRHCGPAGVAVVGASITSEMIWAANGSNEILSQLLQAFGGPGRVALGFEPTYTMHRLTARGTGTEYRTAARTGSFDIDIDAAVDQIRSERPDVIFVCSPNNPTGTSTALADVERLYDAVAAGPEGVLVIDEAYSEFSSRRSAVDLLPGRPRLIVSRTMSKAFAFAGARVGYLVADPRVVDAVQLVRLPYHLSSLTQAAAIAALDHADSLMIGVGELKRQRDRIIAFCDTNRLPAVPSDANFVLVGGFADSATIWHQLVERGVLVRDVGLAGWLRVTAGTADETTAFLAALSDILGVPATTTMES